MSLKPIINDVSAKDNKSLNLYASTIETNDLSVSGPTVEILGGVFPDSTTATASDVLTNVDGLGNLQWADPSNSGTITNGSYASGITNLVGGANLNETNEPSYIRVGDTVTISGTFRCDVTAKTLTVDIDLLPGTTNSNTEITLKCSGNAARASGGCLTEFDVTVAAGAITMLCYSVNDVAISAPAMTNTVFHYIVTYRNN